MPNVLTFNVAYTVLLIGEAYPLPTDELRYVFIVPIVPEIIKGSLLVISEIFCPRSGKLNKNNITNIRFRICLRIVFVFYTKSKCETI